MEAYLDNSATTKVLDDVCDTMLKTMKEDYGNPSAMHLKGVDAEKYLKEARESIANILKTDEKEIFFTSGGTESNNIAIIGTALANKRTGMHIITTEIEHASVHNTMEFLKENGFRITYLPVNKDGVISIEDLEKSICEDTILISVMHVNNEIGSIMPIDEIASVIKRKNPNIIFHVDAIQAFGKIRIYPKRQHIDLLSVSGHKIHGPKGVGFLYIRDKLKIKPIIYGGGQQKGMRSGTENVPGIAGLSVACQDMYQNFDKKIEKLYELKDYLIDQLSQLENVTLHSRKGILGAPQIVNASFIGVRSEVLLHSLEDRGIFVSAGSACSTNKHVVSATLKGIGLKPEEIESALRFSLSIFTTKEEIDYAVQNLKELLPILRLYKRN